jgi:U3 small nucleolar RNA-associated protein 13
MNYLALHDYKKAIQLALSMSQPGRLLSLFKNVISSPPEDADQPSIIGDPSVDEVIRTLGGSDLAKLLRFVRDWNTNAKTSTVAQRILLTIVKLRSADEIIQAFGDETYEKVFADGEVSSQPPTTTGRTALKELVDALIPYSERHLSRMEKLVQDSYVVDYILGEMDDGMFDDGFDDDVMEVDTIGTV